VKKDTATRSPFGSLPGTGHSDGISVVEMMMVLVVAGLLLSIALPNFTAYLNRSRVETAANDLEANYRLARQKAVMERATYRLNLNPGAGTYRVEKRQSGSTWVGAPDKTNELPTGVTMVPSLGGGDGNFDLLIDPRGLIDFADLPCLISFQGSNDTLTVSIVRTGRCRTDRDS